MEVDKVGTEELLLFAMMDQLSLNILLDQLFDRFYRVEESRSQETGVLV